MFILRSFILTGGLIHSLTMTGDYQSVHINRSFILTVGLIHSLTMTGDYQSVHIKEFHSNRRSHT